MTYLKYVKYNTILIYWQFPHSSLFQSPQVIQDAMKKALKGIPEWLKV